MTASRKDGQNNTYQLIPRKINVNGPKREKAGTVPYRQENVSQHDEIPLSISQSGKHAKIVLWPFHILLFEVGGGVLQYGGSNLAISDTIYLQML